MGVGVFVEKRERKQKHSIRLYAVDITMTYNVVLFTRIIIELLHGLRQNSSEN